MDTAGAIQAEMPIEKTFFKLQVQTKTTELTSVGQQTYKEWIRFHNKMDCTDLTCDSNHLKDQNLKCE